MLTNTKGSWATGMKNKRWGYNGAGSGNSLLSNPSGKDSHIFSKSGNLAGGVFHLGGGAKSQEPTKPSVLAPIREKNQEVQDATDFWAQGKRRRRGRTDANRLGFNQQRTNSSPSVLGGIGG